MSGEPSYLELGVPDVGAAGAFYGPLLGWEPQAMGGGASVSTSTLGECRDDQGVRFGLRQVVDPGTRGH